MWSKHQKWTTTAERHLQRKHCSANTHNTTKYRNILQVAQTTTDTNLFLQNVMNPAGDTLLVLLVCDRLWLIMVLKLALCQWCWKINSTSLSFVLIIDLPIQIMWQKNTQWWLRCKNLQHVSIWLCCEVFAEYMLSNWWRCFSICFCLSCDALSSLGHHTTAKMEGKQNQAIQL